MNIDIDLPASLMARFEGWHPDIEGACVVIYFGSAEVDAIPCSQFDSVAGRHQVRWPSDDEISEIAAGWLRGRLANGSGGAA